MYKKYSTLLKAWNMAFENFMNVHSHSLSGKELRGAALLKIHHTAAQIMANITPEMDDPRTTGAVVNDIERFEIYKNEFKIITDLSRSLVTAAEQDVKRGRSGITFSTDLGLVGPLYYTCVRCQDRNIRNQAMELLLHCPRREGMWDSEAGVRMIREFWEIEERHRILQTGAPGEIGIEIPLSDIVDLVFNNEMKWEWKWKMPSDESSTGSRESSASRSSTPNNDWTTCWRTTGAYMRHTALDR